MHATDVTTPERPFVSIIAPMRNEEKHVEACLAAILANDYPADRYEILVVDGLSTDRSQEIVRAMSEKHPQIRLLESAKRPHAAALNYAIQQARGEVIVRIDIHTQYALDYVRRCVELLLETGAANVGGVQRPVGRTPFGRAVAAATSSPYGIGNARFRYAKKVEETDSVYLGTWRKETLDAIGGYDERWAVNEDYELNVRLRERGGKVLTSPDIRCEYLVRHTWRGLAKQYFRYGMWRVKTMRAHPRSVKARQLAPGALVASLLAGLAFAALGQPWLAYLAGAGYGLASVGAAVAIARPLEGRARFLVLPVLWTLHVSYGLGTLAGAVRFGMAGR